MVKEKAVIVKEMGDKMKDRRRLSSIQLAVMIVSVMLMIVTVALQLTYFNITVHIILCSFIVILTIVTIIFDILLKEKIGKILGHICWICIWVLNPVLVFIFNR